MIEIVNAASSKIFVKIKKLSGSRISWQKTHYSGINMYDIDRCTVLGVQLLFFSEITREEVK